MARKAEATFTATVFHQAPAVDGVAQFSELVRDAWGRLIALVQFDGVEHTAVSVKVYRAVEE